MASPTPFYKIICLVICVGLAWFSVVAKPIELPALSQRRYMSNSSQIVDAVEGARNDGTHSVNNYLPKTWTIATPPCLDHGHCASGYVVADIAPNMHTLTCSPPSQCSLNGEGVSATCICDTQGGKTMKFNALPSALPGTKVEPVLTVYNHEYSPAPYSAVPVGTAKPAVTDIVDTTILPWSFDPASHRTETITFIAKVSSGHSGEPDVPEMTLSPEDAPTLVSGQQTVYVTITEDLTTASPIPTEPFSDHPLSTVHPESNKTAIILGSVFGSLTVLCILIVSVDHLLKLKRQNREELQECQENHENHDNHDPIASVEDMSELLRQQQQTYGYYGTQRVPSSSIVPQQMKVLPPSSEPVELPTPKDGTVEKEQRDGY